jgi:hypothetical protein
VLIARSHVGAVLVVARLVIWSGRAKPLVVPMVASPVFSRIARVDSDMDDSSLVTLRLSTALGNARSLIRTGGMGISRVWPSSAVNAPQSDSVDAPP